ncbi:unnamed protein product [Rotaria magnacalcarata]|uniref:Uncharacterized protein n=4 Tax=Rotaria magnacalcarata TaxID=392030 RepID=A0A815XC00_9BILA|nr:unnamed protein product [Rotaria magnacalcarata]
MASAAAAGKPLHLAIREPKQRCVENLILVWYDPSLNSDEDERRARKTISEFQHIISWNQLFNDHKACVEFLTQIIKDQRVFFVISPSTSSSDAHNMIFSVQHLVSIDSIYVMGTTMIHEDFPRKVKSGFLHTIVLSKQLQKDIKQCEQDLVRVNKQGGSSFMYSQLLKEILVENIDKSTLFVKIYAHFCRLNYDGNAQELRMIDEFEKTYGKEQHCTPIWWYTRRCFVSRTLTRAINRLDVEILSVIHFFIRDLHNQLVKIHTENSKYEKPFIVYRGQGMQKEDFELILNKKETCVAFNSFLFTTTERQAALNSAQNALDRNLTAVLFEMDVDPSLNCISPFARIGQLSCAKKNKNQILFSMHATFHIESIEQSDSSVWNVKLKLCNTPNDPLIDRMRERTKGNNVLFRMGALLIEMGEFDKAREIYSSILVGGVSKDDFYTQAHLQNRLAFIFKKIDRTDFAQYHYNEYLNLIKKHALENELECANLQEVDCSEIVEVAASSIYSSQKQDGWLSDSDSRKLSQVSLIVGEATSIMENEKCYATSTLPTNSLAEGNVDFASISEELRRLEWGKNNQKSSILNESISEKKSEETNKRKKDKKHKKKKQSSLVIKGFEDVTDKSGDENPQSHQPAFPSANENEEKLEKEFWSSEFGRTNQTQRQALHFLKQSSRRDHHRRLDLTQQLKRKPRVVVQVGGNGSGRLAASQNSVLFSPSNTTILLSPSPSHELYCINRHGNKLQIELNNEKRIGIQAVCWSSYLEKFIVLTADKIKRVYTFDEKKTTTNNSQHMENIPDSIDREYESCTCSDQIFLVTYKGFNPIIDQWQLSNWKRTKLWQPPISCGNLEMIHHIRFSENNSLHIGLIINQFEIYRFELRNYLTMECLQTVDFNESNQINTPVPISLSTGEWLFTATIITFISKNIIARLPIEYENDVENAIQVNQDCLVIKTTDGNLRFYNYHD